MAEEKINKIRLNLSEIINNKKISIKNPNRVNNKLIYL